MLWYGLRKRMEQLQLQVTELRAVMLHLEAGTVERVAALENAADLYNRAAARAERSKRRDEDPEVATSFEDIRARRGGY